LQVIAGTQNSVQSRGNFAFLGRFARKNRLFLPMMGLIFDFQPNLLIRQNITFSPLFSILQHGRILVYGYIFRSSCNFLKAKKALNLSME